MKTPLILIAATIALGLFYIILPFTLDVYRRFRYRKVVTCLTITGWQRSNSTRAGLRSQLFFASPSCE